MFLILYKIKYKYIYFLFSKQDSDQYRLSVTFLLAWLWPNVGSVSVPILDSVPSKCSNLVSVIVAQCRRFWSPDSGQCIWTDSGPPFIPRPSRVWHPQSGRVISSWPLSGRTILSTTDVISAPLYCSDPLPDTIEYHCIVKIPTRNQQLRNSPTSCDLKNKCVNGN